MILRGISVFVRSDTESMMMWLQIASELQKLSERLKPIESTKLESKQLRQRYKKRLLTLKEQAIRNSLIDKES